MACEATNLPRKKANNSFWFPAQESARECAPAIGTPRYCGFCSINLINIPCGDTLGVDLVLAADAPHNSRTSRLFSREYCSEYCVVHDAMAMFSPMHKAAYIARAKHNRPQWLSETFESISVGRGSRIGQIAPPNYTSAPSGDRKYARRDAGGVEGMQM